MHYVSSVDYLSNGAWNLDVHPDPTLINRSDRPSVSSTGWSPLHARWSPAMPGYGTRYPAEEDRSAGLNATLGTTADSLGATHSASRVYSPPLSPK